MRRPGRAGVEVMPRRGKRGHVRVRYGGRSSVVPMHSDEDIGANLLRDICKQLGLDPKRVQ
jgi:predicted RNA binding protein YcfA (HicA-like mRNA interferase family)